MSIGTADYNFFRPDVASLFPGLANSGGPSGFRVLDTTALADGVHTIAWVVTDNSGAASGIGSRYFTVRNSADAPPSGLTAGADAGRAMATLPPPRDDSRFVTVDRLSGVTVTPPESTDSNCASSYAVYLVVNGELRDLPAGATLERNGALSWQPGAAFQGRYNFALVRTDCGGEKSTTRIVVTVR